MAGVNSGMGHLASFAVKVFKRSNMLTVNNVNIVNILNIVFFSGNPARLSTKGGKSLPNVIMTR